MENIDKVIEIFVIVDEFCKKFDQETETFLPGNKPKRRPKMSKSEVITIIILFHLKNYRT